MILNTKPAPTTNLKEILVAWSIGSNKKGILRVSLPSLYTEAPLIAELCAIRHLLLTEAVFNVRTIDGKGIQIHSSSGAIKKLALGKSAKKEAAPFARFLRVRLTELSYSVLRNNAFLPEANDPEVTWGDLHVLEEQFQTPYEPVECGALGAVAITEHAIERYQERNDSGDMRSPLRSLLRRLNNENLVQLPLSQEVIDYKNRKYGSDNDIEVWGHYTSDVSFLLLNKDGHKVLLTVFIKPKLKTIQEKVREDLQR